MWEACGTSQLRVPTGKLKWKSHCHSELQNPSSGGLQLLLTSVFNKNSLLDNKTSGKMHTLSIIVKIIIMMNNPGCPTFTYHLTSTKNKGNCILPVCLIPSFLLNKKSSIICKVLIFQRESCVQQE